MGCLNEQGYPEPRSLDYVLKHWWDLETDQERSEARDVIWQMSAARNEGLSYRPEKDG